MADQDLTGGGTPIFAAVTLGSTTVTETDAAASTAYRGGYNASTNTPDLDVSPSGIVTGDMYEVSVAGTFYATPLAVNDVIISKQDNPTQASHWIIITASASGTVDTSGSPIAADYAKFTDANTIEGRSYSEVKTDLSLNNVDNTSDATKDAAATTLTNKTLTNPVINTGVSGTAVQDDDTFASPSATKVASSESIKAYVDNTATASAKTKALIAGYVLTSNVQDRFSTVYSDGNYMYLAGIKQTGGNAGYICKISEDFSAIAYKKDITIGGSTVYITAMASDGTYLYLTCGDSGLKAYLIKIAMSDLSLISITENTTGYTFEDIMYFGGSLYVVGRNSSTNGVIIKLNTSFTVEASKQVDTSILYSVTNDGTSVYAVGDPTSYAEGAILKFSADLSTYTLKKYSGGANGNTFFVIDWDSKNSKLVVVGDHYVGVSAYTFIVTFDTSLAISNDSYVDSDIGIWGKGLAIVDTGFNSKYIVLSANSDDLIVFDEDLTIDIARTNIGNGGATSHNNIGYFNDRLYVAPSNIAGSTVYGFGIVALLPSVLRYDIVVKDISGNSANTFAEDATYTTAAVTGSVSDWTPTVATSSFSWSTPTYTYADSSTGSLALIY